MNRHEYALTCQWTGDQGEGTRSYRSYERNHQIQIPGKPIIEGSADPAFRGDAARHNPEDLLLAAISSCHMLWYLHLCAQNGLVLREYVDDARAWMEEGGGGGAFVDALLKPRCRFNGDVDVDLAAALHHEAHRLCFIANSVNFPIRLEPVIESI